MQRAGDPRTGQRLRRRRTRGGCAIRPGISCSASRISLRPNSARDRSATLKSSRVQGCSRRPREYRACAEGAAARRDRRRARPRQDACAGSTGRARGRSPGRRARPRGCARSAASIARDHRLRQSVPAATAILAATSSSSGPRWSVFMWMTRSTPAPATSAAWIAATLGGGRPRRAAGSCVSIAEEDRDHHQQDADGDGADAVPARASPVTTASADADEREAPGRAARRGPRAGRRAARAPWPGGRTAPSDWPPRTLLDSTTAVRKRERLEDDRDAAARRSATTRAGRAPPGAWILCHALVQREQATDAEQHDRDDEGVDVALAAVAERVLRRRRPRGPDGRRPAAAPGCPESATEWTDSASIDEEPVTRKATNLVTAMPRLASSAATTALVPPSALTRRPGPIRRSSARRWERSASGRRRSQQREVDAGEVADRAQASPSAPAGACPTASIAADRHAATRRRAARPPSRAARHLGVLDGVAQQTSRSRRRRSATRSRNSRPRLPAAGRRR